MTMLWSNLAGGWALHSCLLTPPIPSGMGEGMKKTNKVSQLVGCDKNYLLR